LLECALQKHQAIQGRAKTRILTGTTFDLPGPSPWVDFCSKYFSGIIAELLDLIENYLLVLRTR
jgi:hypothetical protein